MSRTDPWQTRRVIPYREAAARPEPGFRVEGVELVLRDDPALPSVCLQCGSRKDVTFSERTLTTNNQGMAGGAAGGIVGSIVAQTAKRDVLLAVLLGAGIAGVVGLIVYLAFKPKPDQIVRAALPYCTPCEDKGRAAISRARWMGIGALAAIALAGIAATQRAWLVVAVCSAAFVAVLIIAIRGQQARSVVRARQVLGREAFLVGVASKALQRIAARLEPPTERKRKKKRPPPAPLPPLAE